MSRRKAATGQLEVGARVVPDTELGLDMTERVKLGDHYVTWKGFAGVMVTVGAILVGLDWFNSKETNARIETRVSRDEFIQHVTAQNRWQDRMESRLDARAGVHQEADVRQNLFVELPDAEARLRDQRIREILVHNGYLKE